MGHTFLETDNEPAVRARLRKGKRLDVELNDEIKN